jgi:DDE superfamily endonuclease
LAEGKKNAERRKACIVFEDESGLSLIPPVRRTWAPRGHTPILRSAFNWKRVSMAAAIAYRPTATRTRIVFQTRPGAYNDEALISFLAQLRHHLRTKVTLCWDGLPAHRSRKMRAFLRNQRHWLVVEQLPAYAAVPTGDHRVHERHDLAARTRPAPPITEIDDLVRGRSSPRRPANVAGNTRPALATACSSSKVTTSWSRLCEDRIKKVPS